MITLFSTPVKTYTIKSITQNATYDTSNVTYDRTFDTWFTSQLY